MLVIDTNALLVLVVGMINPRLISKHKRTSIYEPLDYELLLKEIGDLKRLVVLPNVWTELDNLLNGFGGEHKYAYAVTVRFLVEQTTEEYMETSLAADSPYFHELGVTDCLLLALASREGRLISRDSRLSDFARAMGVDVYDLVEMRNRRL